MGNVDGLLEKLFLGQLLLVLRRLRRRLPFGQEDFARTPDHVAALVLELRVALPHLVPDAAQRVVGEELDDVAGREELVAEGQFIGVARGGALLADLIPQFLRREILVHPADGLVLGPDVLEVVAVEQGENVVQHPLRRKQPIGRVGRARTGRRSPRTAGHPASPGNGDRPRPGARCRTAACLRDDRRDRTESPATSSPG